MGIFRGLAVLGGADPSDPLEPNNKVRHIAVGCLLICVALWACAAVTAMFHSALQLPWPVALGAGLLLALIIFSIDLLITCTPLKGDKFRYRAGVIGTRGIISLTMGLVIAHSTILFVYQDSLQQIISAKNQGIAQAETKRIEATSQWTSAIGAANQEISSDESQINTANQLFSSQQNQVAKTKTEWLNDRVCSHGDKAADGETCGPGPVSDTLHATYETLLKGLPAERADHEKVVTRLQSDIIKQSAVAKSDTAKRSAQIKSAVKADLENTGLAAQSEALWTLLRQNYFLWLLPAFFIAIDLAVALMKGILPESDFDQRRRWRRQEDIRLNSGVASSSAWSDAAEKIAQKRAEVAVALAGEAADRELAALNGRGGAPTPRWRRPQPSGGGPPPSYPGHRPPGHRIFRKPSFRRPSFKQTMTGILLPLAVSVAITATITLGHSPKVTGNAEISLVGGQSHELGSGEKLTIPVGAITGNAPVVVTYEKGQSWSGNTPASQEIKLSTTGKIVGKPTLSLAVPKDERGIALSGALHIAFESPESGDWIPYQSYYDEAADDMVAVLSHFSTWRFWTLDWAASLAK